MPKAHGARVASPDGRLQVQFEIGDVGAEKGCLLYSINHDGHPVLLPSRLGLELDGAAPLANHFEIVEVTAQERDETWAPLYGERATIRDHYHQITVEVREAILPRRRLQLTFRAYDVGVALRYHVPQQEHVHHFIIAAEHTQFRFVSGCHAYQQMWTEDEYCLMAIDELGQGCERPLTVHLPSGSFAVVAEAAMLDYARMLLAPVPQQPNTLSSALSGPVTAQAPFATPWRVVAVAAEAAQLPACSDLFLNLSPPCVVQDTSWIKPGKAIREIMLSTRGGKACVDFAVQHNLGYVLYDAGWYGHEYDDAADATGVSLDPERVAHLPEHDGLDLREVIDYGAERGIGIWLYVNRRALERQLEQLLPLYQEWGVRGIKFGFVTVGSQGWTQWLHHAVRRCAEFHLMVDIHDNYRPTGLSRTYPHLLTQEGIRGNEHFPTARHNVTLPFTRFVAGAADYTICYRHSKLTTTDAHQMAMAVVYYSPLQLLFWYDRPHQYQNLPELEFFARVPTVWDETRTLNGCIGEYVTMARRSGEEWFLGSMTNEEPRTLQVALDFLPAGHSYHATLYADAKEQGEGGSRIAITRCTVDANTVLDIPLAPCGGLAVHLAPAL